MASSKKLTQPSISSAPQYANWPTPEFRRVSVISRGFDFLLFMATLVASMIVILAVALATPFVVLLSVVADFGFRDDNQTGWTTEKPAKRTAQ